jgi:hypothetical protein
MKRAPFRSTRNATVFIAACAVFHWAVAQNSLENAPKAPKAPNSSNTPCLNARDVQATDLYGTWRVELSRSSLAGALQIERGSVVFEKNPEFADSVVGWLQWGKDKIFVAGDVEAGSFSLEESDDGTRISAGWEGTVAEGSCGKAITGSRRVGEMSTPFVLRKATGWN